MSDTANDFKAVTPSDTATIDRCAALYIGVGGDLVLTNTNGVAVTFVGVPAGLILPVKARQVRATSTTAASIVALYE
jgi:hypothetical protein